MIGSLIKAFAYAKAPKTTYTALHPKNAARLKKLEWDMKHAYAPRLTALGVAAVALPLGIILGRLTAGRRAATHRGPRVNPNARRTGWPDEVGARPRTPHDDTPRGYETDAPRAHVRTSSRSGSTVATTARSTTSGTAPSTSPLPRGGTDDTGPGI